MRTRTQKWNPKRRIRAAPETDEDRDTLERLAQAASYGGNPEHKRNPGDFNLLPPSNPRPGKTLCDGVKVFSRAEARELLREGLRRGIVSEQDGGNGWPQNIWAVTRDGLPLEAQLEQRESGTYHGYPLQDEDPLYSEVVSRWNAARP